MELFNLVAVGVRMCVVMLPRSYIAYSPTCSDIVSCPHCRTCIAFTVDLLSYANWDGEHQTDIYRNQKWNKNKSNYEVLYHTHCTVCY